MSFLVLMFFPPFSDLWERNPGPDGEHCLAHLVHTHGRLVSLVRNTEASYSLILQCYYGSTVRINWYHDGTLKILHFHYHINTLISSTLIINGTRIVLCITVTDFNTVHGTVHTGGRSWVRIGGHRRFGDHRAAHPSDSSTLSRSLPRRSTGTRSGELRIWVEMFYVWRAINL